MPSIRHEVLIGAPAEHVYRALTTQEGLAAWWTPESRAIPARETIARFGFGPDYFKEMIITGLEPSKTVDWHCVKGADEWVGTTISFELHPGDPQTLSKSHPELADQIQQQNGSAQDTLVVLQHDGWREQTPMFAECNYTWAQFLRSLKSLCETGEGQPWPHQHALQPRMAKARR
jgi:uncharacterized protein YndB with AHSA1/START domain